MDELRKAAERLLEALDDGWIQRDDWVAFELRQAIDQTKNQMPTTLCGPNLEQILNAAGFYKQREWVGLTDEEIEVIQYSTGTQVEYELFDEGEYGTEINIYPEKFARAIEAKLKEKNT